MRKLLESAAAAIQIAAHLLLYPLLRGWRQRWGATEEERALALPGDELVPDPQWSNDHAVSIAAPRSAVWPWLVQVGQGRGGFYSYEGLENIVGCRIRNVYEVRPDLQELRVRAEDSGERLLGADLVLAAGGRAGRIPAWLEELGYPRPPEEKLPVGLLYVTRCLAAGPVPSA